MRHLFIRTDIQFEHRLQALLHIGATMLEKQVVHPDYPAALLAREEKYPTGIALERHAVAIPHCEANYAKAPAIYLIRPQTPVIFQRADEDSNIAVSLIIALIVENPSAQLQLLRRLFSKLQNPQLIDQLLSVKKEDLGLLFRDHILMENYHIENL